jgi:hypothetical protein
MGELVNGKVYLNTTIWMNAGLSQFHIPVTNRGVAGPKNNLLRGKIGIDVPSLDELRGRLEALVKHEHIADMGTRFSFQDAQLASGTPAIEVVSPSGVTFIARAAGPEARDTRCYHPGPLSWCLGVSYVDIDCPVGSTPGITRFYEHYFHAIASFTDGVATIRTGPDQVLRFVEQASSKEPQHETVPYHDRPEGLHICVYLYDHAGPTHLSSSLLLSHISPLPLISLPPTLSSTTSTTTQDPSSACTQTVSCGVIHDSRSWIKGWGCRNSDSRTLLTQQTPGGPDLHTSAYTDWSLLHTSIYTDGSLRLFHSLHLEPPAGEC